MAPLTLTALAGKVAEAAPAPDVEARLGLQSGRISLRDNTFTAGSVAHYSGSGLGKAVILLDAR